MKKRYVLKSWVKDAIAYICIFGFFIFCGFIFKISLDRFEANAKRCDEVRGYTCTYYDTRQFLLNGGK